MTFQRYIGLLATASVVVACSGCVGQRNAIQSQEELRAATKNAVVFANSLEKAMTADWRAHQETRATLNKVLEEWKERRVAAARLPIIEARAEALLSIESNLVHTLQAWQVAWHEAHDSLQGELSSRLAPWESAAKDAEEAALTAAQKAAAFPHDLELALASTNAHLHYTGIAALYNTTELRTRTHFVVQWDMKASSLTESLLRAAETQRQAVENASKEAMQEIAEIEIADFTLGPDPTNNAELMRDFTRYLETVELTSEATKDYLESNSLGKGSFFHGALKAFGKGFFSALPLVGTGEGATLEEVKSSGKDLLQATQIEFEKTANLAATTARTTMKEALEEALKDARGVLGSAFNVANTQLPAPVESSGQAEPTAMRRHL